LPNAAGTTQCHRSLPVAAGLAGLCPRSQSFWIAFAIVFVGKELMQKHAVGVHLNAYCFDVMHGFPEFIKSYSCNIYSLAGYTTK
jgi:hypothetical protein